MRQREKQTELTQALRGDFILEVAYDLLEEVVLHSQTIIFMQIRDLAPKLLIFKVTDISPMYYVLFEQPH